MTKHKSKTIKIKPNQMGLRSTDKLKRGDIVWVQATVQKVIARNYARIEIHDGVCGMHICQILVHHAALLTT